MTRLCLARVLWMFGLACSAGPARTGEVRVGLEQPATACADHCVDGFGAQLFDADGTALGPSREVPCGQPIVFVGLEAGRRIRVQAFVTSGGVRRFEGEAGPVTVLADEVVSVPVLLQPLEVPVIAEVSPDPAWPAETLSLSGSGFGLGGGLHQVDLDGRPLEVAAWSPDQVTATLGPADDGGYLTVTDCGVSSSAVRVRVLVESPGVRTLHPLGCSGWSLQDATAVSGGTEMVLALACEDPREGYLVRYDPASCTPFGLPTSLGGTPAALVPVRGEPAVLVAEKGVSEVHRVPLPLPERLPAAFASLPEATDPIALAATDNTLFCLVSNPDSSRALWRVDLAGASQADPVLEDLVPDAIAAGPARLVAVGRTSEPAPVLATLSDEGLRVDVHIPSCPQPSAVAVTPDGRLAMVACAGSEASILRADLDTFEVATVPLAVPLGASSIAIDLAGDAALVFDAAAGMLVAASTGATERHRAWSLAPRAATRAFARAPGRDWFILTGASAEEMTVVAPYQTDSPCSDEEGVR